MILTGIIEGQSSPENCPQSTKMCSTGQVQVTSGGGRQRRLKKEEGTLQNAACSEREGTSTPRKDQWQAQLSKVAKHWHCPIKPSRALVFSGKGDLDGRKTDGTGVLNGSVGTAMIQMTSKGTDECPNLQGLALTQFKWFTVTIFGLNLSAGEGGKWRKTSLPIKRNRRTSCPSKWVKMLTLLFYDLINVFHKILLKTYSLDLFIRQKNRSLIKRRSWSGKRVKRMPGVGKVSTVFLTSWPSKVSIFIHVIGIGPEKSGYLSETTKLKDAEIQT